MADEEDNLFTVELGGVEREILAIEDQISIADGRSDPVWRKRAETALKRRRRQRPSLQQRIGELRRAERQAAAFPPVGPGPAG